MGKVKTARNDLAQMEANIFFQMALANMAAKFVEARLATDVLLKVDFGKTPVNQWNADHDNVMAQWKDAEQAVKSYRAIVEKMPENRFSSLSDPTWRIVKVARDLTRGDVLAAYDAAPPGMKLTTVAAILNVDIKTANEILQALAWTCQRTTDSGH